MKYNCDILNFEWSTNSRDTNIIEPVLCYLELNYRYNIVRENYDMYMFKLEKYRPKMIVLSNHTGAPENLRLIKRANDLGILTVSLMSEGDVKNDKSASNFFWGWNSEKKKYVDLFMVWSERAKRIFIENIPEAKNFNLKVCGGTGFDRYKLMSFMDKTEFLQKYNRKETKIVGIASWGFDAPELSGDSLSGISIFSKEELDYLNATRDRLNVMYDKLISSHEDTLFILKLHPGCMKYNKTEFYSLEKHKNTILFQNEVGIADIINVSDFWMGFETTTAMESWLLGKESLFVNPTGGVFQRSNIVNGSLEIVDYEGLEMAYKSFYENGHINGFESLEYIRKQLISEIIGFGDGRNHERAARYIHDLLESKLVKPISNLYKKEANKEKMIEIKTAIIAKLKLNNLLHLDLGNYYSGQYDKLERQKEREKYISCIRKNENLN